ncbi:MAG: DUF3703 domain-containing protein [Bacteroidota bacterium]
MKLYLKMPSSLTTHYNKELNAAKNALRKKEFVQSWQHLERAHILGQPYPIEHTAVHWKMLHFGIKIKNVKEVIGQIPRLLIGGVKSFVGKIPTGNTGGANVSALKRMEIPKDLQNIINQNK